MTAAWRGALALAFTVVATVAVAAPDRAASSGPSSAAITRALAAVRALGQGGRDHLDRAMYDAARTTCHADITTPTVPCLVDAARALCKQDSTCMAAADVVATNLLAAPELVDAATRFRLVRGSTDYHAALAAELRRRYAMLATELALAAGDDDVPAAIGALCRDRDRVAHPCALGEAACAPSLPWSRCVAALVWFVGGEGGP
jgi:hypothetical protein